MLTRTLELRERKKRFIMSVVLATIGFIVSAHGYGIHYIAVLLSFQVFSIKGLKNNAY